MRRSVGEILVSFSPLAVAVCACAPRPAPMAAPPMALCDLAAGSGDAAADAPIIAPPEKDAGRDSEPPKVRRDVIDFGDRQYLFDWDESARTLSAGVDVILPPLAIESGRPIRCLHVTGYAQSRDADPTTLVVVSVFSALQCGTQLGASRVYRFHKGTWAPLVDTAGAELYMRPNGPDVIEWKLRSAESSFDVAPWSRSSWKGFPPATPRATQITTYGFMPPVGPAASANDPEIAH